MLDAGLGDFFSQLPPFFLIMFCGSGIALVISLAFIVNARRQKAIKAAVMTNTPAHMPLMAYEQNDMPDLDDLLRPEAATAHPPTNAAARQELHDGTPTEAVEIMAVLRDITSGKLLVRMQGTLYRLDETLPEGDVRTKLNGLLKEMAQGIGTPLQASAPRSIPPESPRLTDSSVGMDVQSSAFDLPKFSIDSSSTPMTRKDLKAASKSPIPQIDIAGAIEAFLQHKLATSRAFVGRQIHVKSAPDGGLRIQVDGRFYEAVGDVEEADIRDFLQATIAEWQDRQ